MMTRLLIYGFGKRFYRLEDDLLYDYPEGYEITAIIDKKKYGTTYKGIPILPPSEMKNLLYDKIWITPVEYNDILNELLALGIKKEKIIFEPYAGYRALEFIIKKFDFKTVLDIGCGEGQQAERFLYYHKRVACIDIGKSVYFQRCSSSVHTIIGDFNTYDFSHQKFDCVWCCHVLEHQLNVNFFLKKINKILKSGGVLAITVPPMKQDIVGGHLSVWNAGLVLYNLVVAGFDCREASICQYGYNISVVLRKKEIDVLKDIEFDTGDIQKLQKYFPKDIQYKNTKQDTPFDGNIRRMNWDYGF